MYISAYSEEDFNRKTMLEHKLRIEVYHPVPFFNECKYAGPGGYHLYADSHSRGKIFGNSYCESLYAQPIEEAIKKQHLRVKQIESELNRAKAELDRMRVHQ